MARVHKTSGMQYVNHDADALALQNPILSATTVCQVLIERDLLQRSELDFTFAPRLGGEKN